MPYPTITSRDVRAVQLSPELRRTLRQRAQLRRTYGRDWRKRVFGGVDVQRVRAAIANGNRDQLDLYDQLMLDRAEWLARAAGALDDARPAF